jgi:ADP-ribose pyrophosphatase YjhB (NUDIX family)
MNLLTKEHYEGANYCLRCGTALELKDDAEGKLRAVCPKCEWTFYRNPVPVVAAVIINDKEEVVMIKRKFPPRAGEWALPSGYLEIYQTPEEGVVEEMLEETGLIGEVDHFIGYTIGENPFYIKVLSLCFAMRIKGGELRAGDDAIDARFVPLSDLIPVAFETQKKFLEIEMERRGLPYQAYSL